MFQLPTPTNGEWGGEQRATCSLPNFPQLLTVRRARTASTEHPDHQIDLNKKESARFCAAATTEPSRLPQSDNSAIDLDLQTRNSKRIPGSDPKLPNLFRWRRRRSIDRPSKLLPGNYIGGGAKHRAIELNVTLPPLYSAFGLDLDFRQRLDACP